MSLRRVSYIPKNFFWAFVKSFIQNEVIEGTSKQELKNYLQSAEFSEREVILTSSGIQALEIILVFLGYTKAKKLLVPVYTASVVKRLLEELQVDFTLVDINPENANLSLKDLKEKLSSNRFDGILLTHLFGFPVEQEIIHYCKENKLELIEDCAHAHGASYRGGAKCGEVSSYSFFSYDHSKLINGMTGGLLVTNNHDLICFASSELEQTKDKKLIEVIMLYLRTCLESLLNTPIIFHLFKKRLSRHGELANWKKVVDYFFSSRSENILNHTKLSNLQCKSILLQYKSFDVVTKNRMEKIALYEKLLGEEFSYLTSKEKFSSYYFILIVPNAMDFQDKLLLKGFDSGCGDSIMQFLGDNELNFSGYRFAKQHYLQLPIHHKIKEEKIRKIASEIIKINKEYSSLQRSTHHIESI